MKKDEPVNFRVWDAWGKNPVTGETEPTKFYYFKTNLYSRETTVPDEDIKILSNKISKIKPKPRSKVKVHDSCLVVALADWQIGKISTEIAVDQYFKSIYAIKDNLKQQQNIQNIWTPVSDDLGISKSGPFLIFLICSVLKSIKEVAALFLKSLKD